MGNFFSDLFFGKSTDPSVQQVETLSPDQQRLLSQMTNFFTGSPGTPGTPGTAAYDPASFGGDGIYSLLGKALPQFYGPPEGSPGTPGMPASPGMFNEANFFPGAGPLSQQQYGIGGNLSGQAGGNLQQLLQPLNAQGLQQGSQPYLNSLMGQFQDQVVPGIAGQFGALDSARSSGMANVLGRAGAQLPGMAQQQFLGQRQADIGNAFAGLGVGNQIASQQDALSQANANRMQNVMMSALGTPAFANIGMPGTQSASPLTGFGQVFGGLGLMGFSPFG